LIALLALVCACLCAPPCAFAQSADAPALAEQVKQLAEAGTRNKPAGVTRVALIGDSYVHGVGVELDETLSSHLLSELARRQPDGTWRLILDNPWCAD
jgi:hypothetical protein